MYQITIINQKLLQQTSNVYGMWQAEFETLELAREWAQKQIGAEDRSEQDTNISIINLKEDGSYLIKEIREKRKKEYPSELEIIEALMEDKEGRPEKLIEVLQKRDEIKKKYPIPGELKKGR